MKYTKLEAFVLISDIGIKFPPCNFGKKNNRLVVLHD